MTGSKVIRGIIARRESLGTRLEHTARGYHMTGNRYNHITGSRWGGRRVSLLLQLGSELPYLIILGGEDLPQVDVLCSV